ncbi:unnamed protein product [Lymnaea stagnalis]|uniref:Aldehyde oxidase n=1 Tax=Lymnaea stagnalis TaxID=6523 RepID=A0AAV2HZ42_LYMST
MGTSAVGITFNVNGRSYTVGEEYSRATPLLEFLRIEGISTGTKKCCNEGGCGVCGVTATLLDPLTGQIRAYSIMSCCMLLYSCNGMDITTVEGLGNTRDGLHPIQERMAVYDGAQCGYCTPGQVMNMYGLLRNNSKPTMNDVEDELDSTICRCTGYRPILDAMKSFAVDAHDSLKGGVIDIEELDGKICKKTAQACSGNCQRSITRPANHRGGNSVWLVPDSQSELLTMLKQKSKNKYKLVFGNTGFGVYKHIDSWNYNVLIDLRKVKDFYTVDLKGDRVIKLGANLTLTNLKELFNKNTDKSLPYASEFGKHLKRTASSGIRNLGSWAGNLMVKHAKPDFISDIFTMFETVGAKISIADGDGNVKDYTLTQFLALGMHGKVIVSAQLPKYKTGHVVVRTLRTSHRLQVCEAHMACGYNFHLESDSLYTVRSRPSIVIQGISKNLMHATRTEEFLTNKNISDSSVLKEAMKILSEELMPETNGPLLASSAYRKSLALGQFYKFVLGVCKGQVTSRYVSGGVDLPRPIMTGTRDYGQLDDSVSPANRPMMKVTARNLTSGEVKFLDDQPVVLDQLFAAAVLSQQGNAKLKNIDPSQALKMPGVVKFIQASDIPGENNWRPKSWYGSGVSELLSSGKVDYAGQPIGIIVAEDEGTALKAAQTVEVTYTDARPVIVDVLDAIKEKSFFPKLGPFTKGDAGTAMASAPHRVKGNARSGEQYHFHLENQTAICCPSDVGGMDVQATSQWIDVTQETVAQVLGMNVSSVNVETQRLGGAFGGKIFYNAPVAGMCAVAAHNLRRSVKLHMDLATNMQYQGCRQGYYYEYEVGFDDKGNILAIIATGYNDAGSSFFALDGDEQTQTWVDNAYHIPNLSWTVQPCKTHRPVATAMRAPGSATSMFSMESIIDHVATYLKKDHLEVRKLNLFEKGQVTLSGMVLEQCLIRDMVAQMEADIVYSQRKKAVDEFNRSNRWKKRGLHVMPNRYAMTYTWLSFNTSVIIYHADGSVVIAHGAIDMGQGIDTKAIQTCAYKLGIPTDRIKVVKKSTTINANSHFTGGSVCSELICLAVIKSCEVLLQRLAPVREKLTNPTWEELIAQAYAGGVNLTAQYWPNPTDHGIPAYNAYSVSCSEVELEVLTGQYQIRQVDYLYDCGKSLNPELDIGQLEGAFNMGCGLFLLEGMKYDNKTGRALSDGTWHYKLPLSKDLPIVFNIKFLRNAPNPVGVLGSKGKSIYCSAVGETPVAQGACPLFALKRAVEAARAEVGVEGWFPLYAPATVEKLQQACLNDVSLFTFGE